MSSPSEIIPVYGFPNALFPIELWEYQDWQTKFVHRCMHSMAGTSSSARPKNWKFSQPITTNNELYVLGSWN